MGGLRWKILAWPVGTSPRQPGFQFLLFIRRGSGRGTGRRALKEQVCPFQLVGQASSPVIPTAPGEA